MTHCEARARRLSSLLSSGELVDPDTEDVLLAATGGALAGRRLADALIPAVDAGGVSEADVHGLLSAIGLGESDDPAWVTAGGRFRNGVLRGAWHKATATFIGHTAREAARHARLAELHDRAAAARVALSASEQQLAGLASSVTPTTSAPSRPPDRGDPRGR